MIMIVLGVIIVLFGVWAAIQDDDPAMFFGIVAIGGFVWFMVNTLLQFIFHDEQLAYSAELRKVEGTESAYMIYSDGVTPMTDYEVDRDNGRWVTGDSSWDIYYEDGANKVEIYERDTFWWLAVEMDFNPTYFKYTIDEDRILEIN